MEKPAASKTATPGFEIRQATSPADLAAVASIFEAYTRWLDLDLTFQDYTSELASLPGKYAAPKGALLLARSRDTDEALGCIALRPLVLQPEFRRARRRDGQSQQQQPKPAEASDEKEEDSGKAETRYCEVKRLYTLPPARGKGAAKALIREALRVAREEGYNEALLDTLPRMKAAVALYRGEGFVETERYYGNPLEGVLYMSKELGPD